VISKTTKKSIGILKPPALHSLLIEQKKASTWMPFSYIKAGGLF